MKEKYPIKGSNTLYKVWGIIILVFAGLAALMYLLFFILLIVASSSIPDIFPYSLGDTVAAYAAVGVIFLILYIALDLTLQISTGVVLVRNYIKSTGVFLVLAVIFFLRAFGGFISMIFNSVSGSVALILVSLLGIGWNVATGVLLISKSRKADKSIIPPGTGNIPLTPPNPPMHGVIEGIYGVFKGKQVTLHPGEVCRIGRETGCNIQLAHPKVSRVHCMISMTSNGRYQITDYSYNGTFYENKRLSKNIMEEVNPGGMLVIGEASNVLRLK